MIRSLRSISAQVAGRRVYSILRESQDEKLRILFCGSDDFSVKHLNALHAYKETGKSQIASIDVVTRTDKRTGRGLKTIRPPPIKKTTLQHGLPLHQIDTFTGWEPPDINLIVAVSFGLLIPSRIIRSSKFGGLNVHPSLLPDLRGAAPIQWAFAYGREYTGVSIQTLHETKFDHGMLLAQSKPIHLQPRPTFIALKEKLATIGSRMLVSAIKHQLYLPSRESITPAVDSIAHAPKIRDEHRQVDFSRMAAEEIENKCKGFGNLHCFVCTDGQNRRVSFRARNISWYLREDDIEVPTGLPYFRAFSGEDPATSSKQLLVRSIDRKALMLHEMTVEGQPKDLPSVQAAARARLFADPVDVGGCMLYQFKAIPTAT